MDELKLTPSLQQAIICLWAAFGAFVVFALWISQDRNRYKRKHQDNHNIMMLCTIVSAIGYLSMAQVILASRTAKEWPKVSMGGSLTILMVVGMHAGTRKALPLCHKGRQTIQSGQVLQYEHDGEWKKPDNRQCNRWSLHGRRNLLQVSVP